MKPRILFHCMTYKRDYSFIYILSRIFERQGYECIIAGNATYLSKWMKAWNPDIVFFVTLSRLRRIHEAYPKARLFYFAGEAGDSGEASEEYGLFDDEEAIDLLDRVYLWGDKVKDLLHDHIENASENWIKAKRDIFLEKLMVSGNLHFDLLQFVPPRENKQRVKVGFVGNFYLLNHTYGRTLVEQYWRKPGAGVAEKLAEIPFQVKHAQLIREIIDRYAGNGRYEFSFRPYPMENRKTYEKCWLVQTGQMDIDDSISFSSWLSQQDVLIGATSTTMSQIVFTKKPYIIIDRCCQRVLRDYDLRYRSLLAEHNPENKEDIFEILDHCRPGDKKEYDQDLISKLDYYYKIKSDSPRMLTVAKDMIHLFQREENVSGRSKAVPTGLVKRIDDLWTKWCGYKLKDGPTPYDYFCNTDALNQAQKEFDPVFHEIMKLF